MTLSLDCTAPAEELPKLTDSACRAMLCTMGHGAMLHDAAGRVLAVNPSAERILGLTSAQLHLTAPGDPCWRAVREDGAPLDPAAHPVSRTLLTGLPLERVVIGLVRQGPQRTWIAISTRALLDKQGGQPVAAVTTFSDVTARREEVAALELESLVARRTDDAVIITDSAGCIVWVNASFTSLTGRALDTIRGRKPGDVLQGPDTDSQTVGAMGAALACGTGWHGEVLNYRSDGSAFWIDLKISPSVNATGQLTHFVSIARDITSRRTEARRVVQLSAAMAASVDGIALVNSFQDFRFVNNAFATLMGYESGDELLGKSWRLLYDTEALRRFDLDIVPHLYRDDRWRGETMAKRRDGTLVPQELSLSLLAGGSMVVVVRDITDRKAAAEEQARLTAILEATPDLIAISSVAGDVPYLNAAGRRMVGCGSDERLTLSSMYPEWALALVKEEGIPFAVDHGVWSGETALKTRDGREIPVSQVLIAHKNSAGEVEHLSTIMRDITERKEAEESLKQLLLSDQLTGLYNRRGFFMLAQQHLNVARTQPGHAILVYFDINDLKQINDTLGHSAGDDAIKEAAIILRETFRDSDIVGRLGGDEFVALAVNCLDASGQVLLHRLDEHIQSRNAAGQRHFAISIGRGMARFDPDKPKSLQQLLDEADARLYVNKRATKAARTAPSLT